MGTVKPHPICLSPYPACCSTKYFSPLLTCYEQVAIGLQKHQPFFLFSAVTGKEKRMPGPDYKTSSNQGQVIWSSLSLISKRRVMGHTCFFVYLPPTRSRIEGIQPEAELRACTAPDYHNLYIVHSVFLWLGVYMKNQI